MLKTYRQAHDLWVTTGELTFPTRIPPHLARTIARELRLLARKPGTRRWTWGRHRLEAITQPDQTILIFHDTITTTPSRAELQQFITELQAHAYGKEDTR